MGFVCGGKRLSKEADDSYESINRNIPGRQRRLPSFVIEKGYMDFIERMRAGAAWWIPASKGDIKTAVVLGFNRTKPELVLEKWRAAG